MESEKPRPQDGEKTAYGRDVETSPGVAEYFVDPEVEKRVLRKIDMFVMPMVNLSL